MPLPVVRAVLCVLIFAVPLLRLGAEAPTPAAVAAAFLKGDPLPLQNGRGALRAGFRASPDFGWFSNGEDLFKLDDEYFAAYRRGDGRVILTRMATKFLPAAAIERRAIIGYTKTDGLHLELLWSTATPGVFVCDDEPNAYRFHPDGEFDFSVPFVGDAKTRYVRNDLEPKVRAALAAKRFDDARQLLRTLVEESPPGIARLNQEVAVALGREAAEQFLAAADDEQVTKIRTSLRDQAQYDRLGTDYYYDEAINALPEVAAKLDALTGRFARYPHPEPPGGGPLSEFLVAGCRLLLPQPNEGRALQSLRAGLLSLPDDALFRPVGSEFAEPLARAVIRRAREASEPGRELKERSSRLTELATLPGWPKDNQDLNGGCAILLLNFAMTAERAGQPAWAAALYLRAHQATRVDVRDAVEVETALNLPRDTPLNRARRLVAGLAAQLWPALDTSDPATRRAAWLTRSHDSLLLEPAKQQLGLLAGSPDSFLRAKRRFEPQAVPLVLAGSGPDLAPKDGAPPVQWRQTFYGENYVDEKDPAALQERKVAELRRELDSQRQSLVNTAIYDRSSELADAYATREEMNAAARINADTQARGAAVYGEGSAALRYQPPTDAYSRQLASNLESALREVEDENRRSANEAEGIRQARQAAQATINELAQDQADLEKRRARLRASIPALEARLAAEEAELNRLAGPSNRYKRYAAAIEHDIESVQAVQRYTADAATALLKSVLADGASPSTAAKEEARWVVWWFGLRHPRIPKLTETEIPEQFWAKALTSFRFTYQVRAALAEGNPRKVLRETIEDNARLLDYDARLYPEAFGPALREFVLATAEGAAGNIALRDLKHVKLTVVSPDAEAVLASLPEKLRADLKPLLHDVFGGKNQK